MTKIDELVGIKPTRSSLNKEKLLEFVKESLLQIGEINEAYKNLFEGVGDKKALLEEVELKLGVVRQKYNELFNGSDGGDSAVKLLDQKITEIKNYHKELLGDKDSIKADIEDSQNKISEFYNYLFGDSGKEKTVKLIIEDIEKFHLLLKDEKNGYEKQVLDALKSIAKKHTELFSADEGKISKVKEIEGQIDEISGFSKELNEVIKPNFQSGQAYLDELKNDIETKRSEVNSLLSNATARTLAQGYLESMHVYGQVNLIDLNGGWKNIFNSIFRWIVNLLASVFNCLLFITPLVVIAVIFIEPKFIKTWLEITNLGGVMLSGAHYVFYKISVSLPLLWVTWQGQRNIFQRKRLFEEYNHKLRVVQMYLMFISKDNSYELTDLVKLENILLEVIGRNTSEVFGKDETMIDKVIEFIRACKGVVSSAVDDGKKAIGDVADQVLGDKLDNK